jgi:PilZ domain
MALEKLTRGVLHVTDGNGLRYAQATVKERIRLLWLFRNFRILPQHVLPPRHRNWLARLCGNGRLVRYSSALDREMACPIGTLVLSQPYTRSPHEERRRAARTPLPFVLRYGIGSDLVDGTGCDVSETGLAFQGPRAFPVGAEITVHYRLTSNASEPWSRTRAIVRNVEARRMGVEFTIIHPRDRAQLRQLTAGAVPSTQT